jgi:hypothetical protein
MRFLHIDITARFRSLPPVVTRQVVGRRLLETSDLAHSGVGGWSTYVE